MKIYREAMNDQQPKGAGAQNAVLQVLLRGRERLEHGFAKYEFKDYAGRYCARGAIEHYQNEIGLNPPAVEAAFEYLIGALPSEWRPVDGSCRESLAYINSVPDYNNHHLTTHADILAWFDRAIWACRKSLAVAA